MTDNRTPIRLSALITEGDDWYRRIEQLTGVSTDLPLETLLEPLNLPYKVIDPIMTKIWGFHNEAVTAAFTAGLAWGLCPEKILLEKVSLCHRHSHNRLSRSMSRSGHPYTWRNPIRLHRLSSNSIGL